jgi:hypothetical protein
MRVKHLGYEEESGTLLLPEERAVIERPVRERMTEIGMSKERQEEIIRKAWRDVNSGKRSMDDMTSLFPSSDEGRLDGE